MLALVFAVGVLVTPLVAAVVAVLRRHLCSGGAAAAGYAAM
jgi:hypothetical protein